MKTQTVRLSVDLLKKIKEKFIAEGRAPEMVDEHVGMYLNELLWNWVGGRATLPGSTQAGAPSLPSGNPTVDSVGGNWKSPELQASEVDTADQLKGHKKPHGRRAAS